jgi:hypothetical protein
MPVANLASLTANLNRSSEDRREPYRASDFTFYGEQEKANHADPSAVAAYVALAEGGRLPTWALFCYSKLTAGKAGTKPNVLAAIGEGVVLLAPMDNGDEMSGLLIANRSAAGMDDEVVIGDDRAVVSVPSFEGAVLAREGVTLPVVRGSRRPLKPKEARTPRARGRGPS